MVRRTHCKRGHPLTDDNRRANGGCKTCLTQYDREYRKKKRSNTRGVAIHRLSWTPPERLIASDAQEQAA